MNYVPFVYLLRFKPTGQLYIGSRTAQKENPPAHPDQLWRSYFTSSDKVKEKIEEFGKDAFEYEVRKTFTTREETLLHEHRFLKKVNAKKNPKFLNKSNGNGKFITIEHTKESKKRISDALTGIKRKPFSSEHRRRLADAKFGKPRKQSTKDKISTAGKNMTKETRQKMSKSKIGHTVSDETRSKISNANKGKPMPINVKESLLVANIGRRQTAEHVEKRRCHAQEQNVDPIQTSIKLKYLQQ